MVVEGRKRGFGLKGKRRRTRFEVNSRAFCTSPPKKISETWHREAFRCGAKLSLGRNRTRGSERVSRLRGSKPRRVAGFVRRKNSQLLLTVGGILHGKEDLRCYG